MSAEEFGQADLLNNLAALMLPVLTLSIAEGVFRYALDRNENTNKLITTGLSTIFHSSLVTIILVSIAFIVTKEFYWVWFLIFFISESIRSLLAQFARGNGNVRDFSISGIIAASVLFFATYLFLKKYSLGVNGYLLAFTVANICSILYLCLSVDSIRNYTWSYSKDKTKEILLYTLPLIPNMLSWWITNVSSRYILAYSCGIAVAGLFAATSKLPALINVVTSVFQQSWQISSIKESESDDSLDFYSQIFALYSSAVFVFGAVIILLVPYISKFVLQGDFYQAWIYTPLLLFSALLGCFSVYFGNFYTIRKMSKAVMRTTLYGAGTNIVLCLVLIPFIGVYGALAANVVSFAIIVTIRYLDTRKFMPIVINRLQIYVSLLFVFAESLLMTIDSSITIRASAGLTLLIIALNTKYILKLTRKR